MTKRQEVSIYMRVGSEKQLGDKLNKIRNEIITEEQRMKDLAAQFLESSERYNALRVTQRSLTAQLFTLKQRQDNAKKRG